MALYYNKTPRTTVRRRAGRGVYDRETIDAILDEGLVGHLAFAVDGRPYALPMLYARRESEIYLHGSPLSRLLRAAAAGAPMCLTVTLVDGLVLARSAFHHSINYRSAVVLGSGRLVTEGEEKDEALRLIVEHAAPGRAADARGPSRQELKATAVVAMSIEEASAKARSGPPVDAAEDYALPVWAGELPLGLAVGVPVADPRCAVSEPPAYLEEWSRGRA
jgi:uncharacterized protein